MTLVIEFLNALFAPFAVTPALPPRQRPALHRMAPARTVAPLPRPHPLRMGSEIPLPQAFPTCELDLASFKPLVIDPESPSYDPFLTHTPACKDMRDAMLNVG